MFFLQAEDGIRDMVGSRGLGELYKRQAEVIREGGLVVSDHAPLIVDLDL